MPKTKPRTDGRTLVDRFLDRVKNNRVAATVIIVCAAVGALASLTESTRRLSDAVAWFSTRPELAGEWTSDPAAFYPIGPEVMRLTLREAAGGRLLGSIRFSDPRNAWPEREFELIEGKLEGKVLHLSFDSGARLYKGSGGPSVPLRETVTGEMKGGELNLVYQREGHGGVPVTARRTRP